MVSFTVFDETLDPSETKKYAYDWRPQLGDGETIASQSVNFVAAAGTTCPGDSHADGISNVYLSGGTHGERAIFEIVITTSAGNTLEAALGVDIYDNLTATATETKVERLTRLISEAEDQRQLVALGQAVVEVWRDGRRITKKVSSIDELNSYILVLRRELLEATATATSQPRRRPITIAWRN